MRLKKELSLVMNGIEVKRKEMEERVPAQVRLVTQNVDNVILLE